MGEDMNLFGIKFTFFKVKRIAFLSQPCNISDRPAILPEIRIRVCDKKNRPLKGKLVVLELESYSGKDYMRGILEKTSNESGDTVFSGLEISRCGQYKLLAKSDGQSELSIPFEVTPPRVNRIAFLSQPRDVSGRPAILPDIKIRVYDKKNRPIDGKLVVLGLEAYSGKDYMRGVLEKTSNESGDTVFSGLNISRSGQYKLLAKSDGQFDMSVSFLVTPPGFDTDFSNKPFGSIEYNEAFARKLSLSKSDDELRIDKEEI
jgi:hypothetical protein